MTTDFYPVLFKTIRSLNPDTPACRNAIYDDAREILESHLRSRNATPSEARAKRSALESAIKRIERPAKFTFGRVAFLIVIVMLCFAAVLITGMWGEQPLCPARTAEYISRFPVFETKLEEKRAPLKAWKTFKQQMESIEHQSAIELCQKQLSSMKKIEAEIPESCPGEAASLESSTKETRVLGGIDVSELIRFRDCTEAKSKEIAIQIRKRTSSGGNTAQLQSLLNEITKISTKSITLLQSFREVATEEQQTKCWLRSQIRDCGLIDKPAFPG